MAQLKHNILFIDDSSEDVELMTTMLEHRAKLDFSFHQVDISEDLIASLKAQSWDLIICDFVMPLLTPQEALELCKKNQPNTPFLLVSGKVQIRDVVDMMRDGARAFVEKSEHQRFIELVTQELDITTMRKQVMQTQAYYQSIVDNQTELICRYDVNLRLLFANQAYCDWQGVSLDQLIGKRVIDEIPEYDRERAIGHVKSLTKDNPVAVSVHSSISKDNVKYIIEWTDRAILNDDGEIIEYQGVGRDVTERQETLSALEQSEAYLAKAQAIAHVGHWDWNIIAGDLAWSDEIYRIFGLEPQQFDATYEAFLNTIHPDDRHYVQTSVQAAVDGIKPYSINHRIILPDGTQRIVHEEGEITRDHDGKALHMLGIVQDITEREQNAQQLEAMSDNMRSILDTMQDSIVSVSLTDDEIVYQSASFEKIFGYPYERFRNDEDFYKSIVHPDDLNDAIEAQKVCMRDGYVEFVHRILHPSGETRWIERRAWVVYDDDNFPIRVNDTASDVTDRKQAELHLRERERQLSGLINSQTNYVVRTNLEGKITYWNPKFERDYGWLYQDNELEHAYGLTSILEYHHEHCFEVVEQCIQNPGKIFSVELDKPIRGGGVRTTLWEFICLTDEHNIPSEIQCMGLDITARKQTEIQLVEANERYESLVNSLDSAILLINYIGDVIYANEEYNRRIGYDATGKNLFDMFPEEVVQRRLDVVRQVIDSGKDLLYEIEDRDTEIGHWYRASLQPVRDANGKVIATQINSLDITQRKKQEIALQESEQRFRIVSGLMSDIAIEFRKGDGEKWEQVWGIGGNLDELLGYEPGELSHNWETYIHPDDLEIVNQALEQTLEGHQTSDEYRIRDANGAYKWFASSREPIYDESCQEVVGYMLALKDITDRKAADVAISENERRFRIVSELLSDSATEWVFDENDIAVRKWRIGQEIYEVLGYSAEIMRTIKGGLNYVHPDDQNLVADAVERTRQGFSTHTEYRMLHADGTHRWMQASRQPVYAEDNMTISGYMLARKDITARKEAELVLHESERRFRMISELMSDTAIEYEFDEYGNGIRVWQIGHDISDLLGYDLDGFPTLSMGIDYIHPDDRDSVLQAIERTRKGQTSQTEYRMRASDGSYRWFECSRQPTFDSTTKEVVGYMLAMNDITGEKHTLEALQASETRFKQFMDHMPASTFIQSPDAKLVYCNETYAQSQGMSSDAIVNLASQDYLGVEAEQQILDENRVIVEQNQALNFEYIDSNRSGKFWSLTKFPIPQPNGEFLIGGIAIDVTESEQARHELVALNETLEERVALRTQELESSQNMLRLILDTIPVRVFWKDRHSEYLGANKLFLMDAGLGAGDMDEIIGKDDFELFPSQAELYRKNDREVIINGEPRLNYEEPQTTVDGDVIWLQTSKIPLRNLNDEIIGVLGTYTDITKQKSLARRLQLATDAGEIGVWDWNLIDNSMIWDDHMLKIYGVHPDDFVGTMDTWSNQVHPEDRERLQVSIQDLIENDIPYSEIFRVILPDDAIRYVQANAVVVRDSNGKALRMVGTNIDVTEVREAELTLRSALMQEKELGELKSRFVSMASHEFRTPLAGIMATVETLTRFRSKMNDEQINDRLDKIRGQGDRLKEIMDDVLKLARMQSGRVDFRPEDADIDELIVELVEEFNNQREYDGRTEYHCEVSTPALMTLDRHLMRQIISNIVHNGLKYSEGQVTIRLTEEDDMFIISIQDTGMGIPEADLKRLFEPFHRASNVGTIQGTGLGLSITKQAVEAHGGLIHVESVLNEGSTFVLMLPVRESEEL